MGFVYWYYFTAWLEIARAWLTFIRFWWYFFSIPWLLYTLLTPWRRDITSYGRGFDFARFSQALANNLISRVIGLGVRLVAIITWFFIEILTILGGAVWITAWPLFLPLALVGLFQGSIGILNGYTLTGGLLVGVLLLLGWGLVRGFRHRQQWDKLLEVQPPTVYPAIGALGERGSIRKISRLWKNVLRRLGYGGTLDEFLLRRKEALEVQNLTEEDFARVFRFEKKRVLALVEARRFWEPGNLFSTAPLGRSWAYGYTVNLDAVARELGVAHGALCSEPRLYAEEFQQMENILARSSGNNVLIVGEPGVGRTIVVEDFARLLHQGRVANSLSHKRLIELNREAAPNADLLGHILTEAEYAGNVILVLPMFEHYAGHADILTPHLKSSRIQIIATTSYAELHGILERSPELLGHFEKVEIKEPDAAETLQRVLGELESFESRYGVFVPYPALKTLVEGTDRYIQDVPFPKKAFDLLDRAMSTAAARGETTLTRRMVEKVLQEKTEIPVARPAEEERDLLIHLEERIHERLIGQEEAVKQIADALRRARVDIGARNRPIGSFLFLGPTGVGKTETAKALARLYYGSSGKTPTVLPGEPRLEGTGEQERMIRLDMSEFQEVEGITRLIGDARSNTPGVLTTAIRENPASLVLLDEIEKAHPNILDLFLQVIDDARLTDAWGRTVKFTSACIIATSNAGAERIREAIKNGQDLSQFRGAILDELQAKGVFRVEFLNRFDGVIMFRPLTEVELKKIAFLLLSQLAARLKEQHIIFIPTPELAHEIAATDYQPEFGARAIRRTIQDRVESALAKKILSGALEKGATLEPKSLEEITV